MVNARQQKTQKEADLINSQTKRQSIYKNTQFHRGGTTGTGGARGKAKGKDRGSAKGKGKRSARTGATRGGVPSLAALSEMKAIKGKAKSKSIKKGKKSKKDRDKDEKK